MIFSFGWSGDIVEVIKETSMKTLSLGVYGWTYVEFGHPQNFKF